MANNPDYTEIAQVEIVQPGALEAIERASIDMQISTAKKYPRPDLSIIKKRILDMATMDIETAQMCFYSFKRGGKDIEGPSIRLAEIAATNYRNIRYGSRIIGNDGSKVTAQGVCHDLENNVLVSIESDRKITGRDGNTFSEDMQIMTGNAAAAIARRNAITSVIPRVLINSAWKTCMSVVTGDIKSISTRFQEAMRYFSGLKITEGQVLEYLERMSPEDVTREDIVKLLGLSNALREKEVTLDEVFKPVPPKRALFKKKDEPVAEETKKEEPKAETQEEIDARQLREQLAKEQAEGLFPAEEKKGGKR